MSLKHFILFCNYNPYSSLYAEAVFLSEELKLLKKNYADFTIVPTINVKGGGGKQDVITNYVKNRNKFIFKYFKLFIYFYYSLCSSFFYKEIVSQPALLLNFKKLLRLVAFLGIAYSFRRWLNQYLDSNNISKDSLLLYTYWLCPITFGCVLHKLKHPEIIVFSRAHRMDLYEEQIVLSYHPCRNELLSMIDKVYTVSEHGSQYLKNKHHEYRSKIKIARLGVHAPNFMCQHSTDDIFRIASCSALKPVKRVSILAKVLSMLAKKLPERNFIWCHIGDGVEMLLLRQIANSFPSNLKYDFKGNIPNNKVLGFYKKNPVDVFINVSSSEGVPVSIMEAQSCGIPVIATDVGGVSEVVNEKNGLLLSPDSDEFEIRDLLLEFIQTSLVIQLQKRKESFQTYCELSRAVDNTNKFIDEIEVLANG